MVSSIAWVDPDRCPDIWHRGRMAPPMRIVVMGVAGSGKTTVGKRLAARLEAEYVEADDVHPSANVEKMSAGIPLTDDDRWPWLERLRSELAERQRVVVTCSALKRSYRDVLRRADGVRFVFLDVDREVLEARLADRTDHFMASSMLDSQVDTLEPPGADETDVSAIAIGQATPDEVFGLTLAAVGEFTTGVPRMRQSADGGPAPAS